MPFIPRAVADHRIQVTHSFASAHWHRSSTALFLSASFHPSLPARLILLALLVLIALCSTFLPILKSHHLHRWTLRASSASSGSLGIIVSFSILSGVPGWASVWLRLVVKDAGGVWMSSKEKGLCFVFVLLVLLGAGSDWWIERKWGFDEGPVPVCSSISIL